MELGNIHSRLLDNNSSEVLLKGGRQSNLTKRDDTRYNSYVQRNRHTPLYQTDDGCANASQSHRIDIAARKSQLFKSSVHAQHKDELVYQSPTAAGRLRNSSLQSAVDCLRNGGGDNIQDDVFANIPSEFVFRRSQSFVTKPCSYSDSSNKSRSSDSSQSTGSSYLLNPYSNSSSARSSSSYTKETQYSTSHAMNGSGSSSGNRSTKDQFKAFSSIVNGSMNSSSCSASSRHKSTSPAPTSSHYSRSPTSLYSNTRLVSNLEPVRRQRVSSFKQERSYRDDDNHKIYCPADYSYPQPSPNCYRDRHSKSSSCSPNPGMESSWVNIRGRYVKQKHNSVSESPTNDTPVRNFAIGKSASSRNLRHNSPVVESYSRYSSRDKANNSDSCRFLDGVTKRNGDSLLNSQSNVSKLSNSSRGSRNNVRLTHSRDDINNDNISHLSRKTSGSSSASQWNSPRYTYANGSTSALSNGSSAFSSRSPVQCNGSQSTGQSSARGKAVKRNHSFCNDLKSGRARMLGRLPHTSAGSHHDITQDPDITVKNNRIFFGNLFNNNQNKESSRQRRKSPPKTLDLDPDSLCLNTASPSSIYAVPIASSRLNGDSLRSDNFSAINLQNSFPCISATTPTQHDPKSPATPASPSINLQDSFPQISSTTPTRGVTDSIKSQSSTLLSQMSLKTPTGNTVTPPNAGFDLEALLKIDDLRNWIQELETSRAKGYQTLYSDYDDCDMEEKQINGE